MNLVHYIVDLPLWSIHIEFRILRMLRLSFCSCLCATKEVGKLGHSCAHWACHSKSSGHMDASARCEGRFRSLKSGVL